MVVSIEEVSLTTEKEREKTTIDDEESSMEKFTSAAVEVSVKPEESLVCCNVNGTKSDTEDGEENSEVVMTTENSIEVMEELNANDQQKERVTTTTTTTTEEVAVEEEEEDDEAEDEEDEEEERRQQQLDDEEKGENVGETKTSLSNGLLVDHDEKEFKEVTVEKVGDEASGTDEITTADSAENEVTSMEVDEPAVEEVVAEGNEPSTQQGLTTVVETEEEKRSAVAVEEAEEAETSPAAEHDDTAEEVRDDESVGGDEPASQCVSPQEANAANDVEVKEVVEEKEVMTEHRVDGSGVGNIGDEEDSGGGGGGGGDGAVETRPEWKFAIQSESVESTNDELKASDETEMEVVKDEESTRTDSAEDGDKEMETEDRGERSDGSTETACARMKEDAKVDCRMEEDEEVTAESTANTDAASAEPMVPASAHAPGAPTPVLAPAPAPAPVTDSVEAKRETTTASLALPVKEEQPVGVPAARMTPSPASISSTEPPLLSNTTSADAPSVAAAAVTAPPIATSDSTTTERPAAGVKRTAEAVEELEGERDGRISSSSSHSGSASEGENNQDCKRIRFDESIFEEDERERIIREFVDRSTENMDDVSRNCDKLQQEISALSDLARAKELEWNSIMRLLKLKEEMLERILFKKRHLDGSSKVENNTKSSRLYKSIASNAVSLEAIKTSRSDANSTISISNNVTVVPISSSAMSTSGSISSSTSHDLFKNGNVSIAAVDSSNKHRIHRPILPKPSMTSQVSLQHAPPSSTAASQQQQQQQQQQPPPPQQQQPPSLPPQQPPPAIPPQQTMIPHTIASSMSNHPTSIAQSLLQPTNPLLIDQNSVIGEGRQGPIVDVKSIIADFRSKNPDSLPRRGRRSIPFAARGPDGMGPRFVTNNALLSMANMALGSGSQVRTNVSSTTHNDHRGGNFYLGQDGGPLSATINRPDLQIRPANIDSLMLSINTVVSSNSSQGAGNVSAGQQTNVSSNVINSNASFQEALVKFAKMNEKRDITSNVSSGLPLSSSKNQHITPPPPYPEVTLHPVLVPQYSGSSAGQQNSLLHGILTKSMSNSGREVHSSSSNSNVSNGMAANAVAGNIQHRPTTFSPTLARLLTAPERSRSGRSTATASSNRNTKVALNEILNSKKTRTEVTITPVTSSAACVPKNGTDIDDDDEGENTDRLVIDEGREAVTDASSNVIPADQVPECQGCHKKAAQFVCAGCGNQWYCSRDCQIQAWEEHSEMCSG